MLGDFGEKMLPEGDTVSEKWVNACNKIGSQTQIVVVNHTRFHIDVCLEVAGVVYQRGVLPGQDERFMAEEGEGLIGPIEPMLKREDDEEFLGTNFAAVKLPCGYAWYTVVAVVCESSNVSQGWTDIVKPKRLHFVYGGSKVSVRYDEGSPSKITLVNESGSNYYDSNKLSEQLETTLEKTGESMNQIFETYVAPAATKLRESYSSRFGQDEETTNSARSSGAYGSGYQHVRQGANDYQPPLTGDWRFSEDEGGNTMNNGSSKTPGTRKDSNVSV